ncbi:MAG: Uma2 family endonuclease [Dehalococcoidia bacterium]|nr:Uma2 family endonuclease [Dehalococcoidia bacterium]
MTSKTTAIARTDRELERFPEFPPRDDMQNWKFLYQNAQTAALAVHLGNPETTIVVSEAPLGPDPRDRDNIRVPDLTVSLDSKPELIDEDGGYSIESQGKPTDFVLEVASQSKGQADYTAKRLDYERYGVAEYWRFDPSGGQYHDAALAGDSLVDGGYQPIEVEWLDEGRCRGYSEVLSLYICWEDGELRWFNLVNEAYLRTFTEEIARAERAEGEREAEARRQAEAENRRLRERLQALGETE